jgi:hypothetical protein
VASLGYGGGVPVGVVVGAAGVAVAVDVLVDVGVGAAGVTVAVGVLVGVTVAATGVAVAVPVAVGVAVGVDAAAPAQPAHQHGLAAMNLSSACCLYAVASGWVTASLAPQEPYCPLGRKTAL